MAVMEKLALVVFCHFGNTARIMLVAGPAEEIRVEIARLRAMILWHVQHSAAQCYFNSSQNKAV